MYATTTRVGEIVYPSITNIGVRPTVDDDGPDDGRDRTSSTSIATCTAPSIQIGFVQRLRDERAFESLDFLKAQIAADCARARGLFDHLSL